MIVTVNLKPLLDRTLALPHLMVGQSNRAQLVRPDVGGKGFNVSRALLRVGTPSLTHVLILISSRSHDQVSFPFP